MKADVGYIYLDDENDEILLFSKLRHAQEAGWPEEAEWIQVDDNEWRRGSSCRLLKREVDEDV